MTDRLLGALGLARKAGALAVGADAVREAAQSGTAALVLLAQDAAPRTQRQARGACENRCKALAVPCTMRQLTPITRKPAGVLAITNKHLAVLCERALLNACGTPDKEEPV